MARDSDGIEDMDPVSSSGSADANDTHVPNDVDAAAGSSPATDEANDTLSIIQNVISDDQHADPTAPASSAETSTGIEPSAEAEEVEVDDTDYTDAPFHKHPRFRQVLSRMKAAEGDAVEYRKVTAFMHENDLSPDEAAGILQIGGLAKTNPIEALERIRPWLAELAVAAGAILPPDLDEKVKDGRLTLEGAAEIAKARSVQASLEYRERRGQERQQTQQATEQVNSLRQAAYDWAEERGKKDPHFEEKSDAVMEKLLLLQHREGKPTTVKAVEEQLKKAYAAVNVSFKPSRAAAAAPQRRLAAPAAATPQRDPARPAKAPVLSSGSVATRTAPAKPGSTLDIIQQHAAKRGR